jgi:hypothetical protein
MFWRSRHNILFGYRQGRVLYEDGGIYYIKTVSDYLTRNQIVPRVHDLIVPEPLSMKVDGFFFAQGKLSSNTEGLPTEVKASGFPMVYEVSHLMRNGSIFVVARDSTEINLGEDEPGY